MSMPDDDGYGNKNILRPDLISNFIRNFVKKSKQTGIP
jgi:hypothetical protein